MGTAGALERLLVMNKSAPSAKALFRATKPKVAKGDPLFADLPDQTKPHQRDPLDYDPTPPDATAAFLAREAEAMQHHGRDVWENAVGGGHMARELERWKFRVVGTDIVDRGWPGTQIKSFYDFGAAPAKIICSNPPYNQINARDGHGRWLRHSFDCGAKYVAYLLNSDWAAARINGMDALFREHPPTVEYVCCWKIDFRGGGSPPQRNSWFVWDANRGSLGSDCWIRKRLYRDDPCAVMPDQMNMGI